MRILPHFSAKYKHIEIWVDEANYPLLLKHRWYALPSGYACAFIDGKRVYLHRYLLNAQPGEYVDHVDLDRSNNSQSNLRLCSMRDNNRNRKKLSRKNPYKGICASKEHNSWMARIRVNGELVYLGSFPTPEIAAEIYDEAAKRYFGEFANVNFKETA